MTALDRLRRLFPVLRLGFFGYKLLTLAVNARTLPRLAPAPPHAPPHPWRGRVSLLVPARNEAGTLPRTLPALLAQGAAEVLLLDDRSEDGTGTLARALMDQGQGGRVLNGRVLGDRVLDGMPRPPGWHGKPWACQQLAAAARGEILIFTDADVCWTPGALDAILEQMETAGTDLLSLWPRQECVTPGERLLTPLVDDVLLTLLPTPLVRLAAPSLSAANGQLMAVWAATYWRVGGHALVASEVLEDVQFARRLKERGGTLALGLGGDLLSVRMYRNYAEALPGFAKSLPAVHGNSRVLTVLGWLWHLYVYTSPWLEGRSGRLPALLGVLERAGVNALTGRTHGADRAEPLLSPLTPLAALPAFALALRGRYRWKGREYRRGQP